MGPPIFQLAITFLLDYNLAVPRRNVVEPFEKKYVGSLPPVVYGPVSLDELGGSWREVERISGRKCECVELQPWQPFITAVINGWRSY